MESVRFHSMFRTTDKNASQFSTKLAQFFDIIFKSKFAVGEGLALKTSLGDISERDAAENLKITA